MILRQKVGIHSGIKRKIINIKIDHVPRLVTANKNRIDICLGLLERANNEETFIKKNESWV